ncbi:MAG: inositol monophosphatase [Saprospiraceae bacterium]|nr:inositol monophosphatase [Saprospiraceae bacterium]
MTTSQLHILKHELQNICESVGLFIRTEMDKVTAEQIEEKERNSLVSYVDKEAENRIVKALRQLVPEAGYITEEDATENTLKKKMWIIDPLDGTTNFLYKIPHFSTSIALAIDGEVVLGIVYDIMQKTAYTAIRGEGAWENERPISVKDNNDRQQAIVVTGFPYRRGDDIEPTMSLLRHCILNYRGIRRLGSAALDLAYVAAGKIDIYYERTLNIWDLAAGALLVEEAGGRVTDYWGKDDYLENGSIISSNKLLHPNILKAIQEHLN